MSNTNKTLLSLIGISILLISLVMAPLGVHAAGDYEYYASITIDHNKVEADHVNFPILVSGTYDGTAGEPDIRTVTNGGNVQNTTTGGASGSVTVPADLVFSPNYDGSTEYDFEIEYYSPATGQIIAWVEIPVMDASDDLVFYMVYGDAATTTSQEDVAGTWNSDYIAVYHMGEASGTVYDSTINGHDSISSAGSPTYGATGKIGNAIMYDGDDSHSMADHADWDVGTEITAEVCAYNTVDLTGAGMVNHDLSEYKWLWWTSMDSGIFSFYIKTTSGTHYTTDGDKGDHYYNNAWWCLAGTYDEALATNHLQSWQNGVIATIPKTTDGTNIVDGDEGLNLGDYSGNSYIGRLDEIRISSVDRGAAYIITTYNTYNPATFYTTGSEQLVNPPTPTETLTPTPTSTPTPTPIPVAMGDPSVVVSQDLIDEIQDALDANTPNEDANLWAITDVYTIGNYSMLSIAGLDVEDPGQTSSWYYEQAIWTGTAIIRDNLDTTYTTGLDGDATYLTLLAASTFGNPRDGSDQGGGGGNWIWFPWLAGTKGFYGDKGVHIASLALPGWRAVDWVGGQTYGDESMPNMVYGSFTEPIKSVCRDGTAVGVTTENFYYLHLEDNSSLQAGATIRQGQPIGSLVMGPFNDRCGYAIQQETSYHLHWGFRAPTGYLTAETWTLSMTDELWRSGSTTIGPNQFMRAVWPDHTGPIPTLGPTVTPGGPTLTPGPDLPPPRAYGGDSLWDPFIYGLYGMAKTTAERFPEHEASGIGSQITSGAEIAVRVAFTMLTSNFDLTISLIIFGLIIAAEIVRLIYAIYLGIKKLIPILG